MAFDSSPQDDLTFAQEFIDQNPLISYLVLYVVLVVLVGVSVVAVIACKELYVGRTSAQEEKCEMEAFERVKRESSKLKQN